jgi:tetratricopeptide (TPR) repeat protein
MKLSFLILSLLLINSCDFKSSEEYNAEAEIQEAEGNYTEAIKLLDKAIEKDPNNIYALINRGVDKSLTGDYEGAIEDYSQIIDIDPDNTLALVNRGKNKKRLEDQVGAIEDFDKAIATKGGESVFIELTYNALIDNGYEFDVTMEEIRFERGKARYLSDNFQPAFEDFNFCVEKKFNLAASLYWRGVLYIELDKPEEACLDFNIASKKGDPDAKEMMETHCKNH